MSMKLHSTTILVSDQERSLDFYVNTLGWPITIDYEMGPGMRFVTVTPSEGSAQIAIGHLSWMGADFGKVGGPTGISFTSPDVDATVAELTARGVRFKGPTEDMPWGGRGAWFLDPDDNEFFLASE